MSFRTKTLGRLIVLPVALGVSAGPVRAEELKLQNPATARAFIQELVEPTPLAPDVVERIRQFIADLSHDEWRIREKASKGLLAIGAKAEPMVAKALKSDDLEVCTRAELLRDAYRAMHQDRAAQLTRAADALAAAKDRWAIDSLIKLLTHRDADLRYAAEYGLRRLTAKRFGYNAHAPQAERDAAAEKWRAWWKQNGKAFRFQVGAGQLKIAGVLSWDISTREVFVVSLTGKMLWSRKFDVNKRPYAADAVPNGNVVISFYERGKSVVEEYTRGGKLVWSSKALELRGVVQDVRRLTNGNTLVAEASGRRVIEIDPSGKKIVWQYDCRVGSLASAQRLPNGNTLVCLYTGTVVEVSKAGKVVWAHNRMSMPRDAQKLPNGNVLIAEYGRQRVVEVSRGGKEVWTWTDTQGRPVSACRLPDGRTVVHARRKGLLLVDQSGKVVKTLLENRPRSYEKIRLAPAAFGVPQPKEK